MMSITATLAAEKVPSAIRNPWRRALSNSRYTSAATKPTMKKPVQMEVRSYVTWMPGRAGIRPVRDAASADKPCPCHARLYQRRGACACGQGSK